MDYLLDTHILLWAISDSEKLLDRHKTIIEDKNNRVFVSYFSYIELSIKLKLGKISNFNTNLDELLSIVEMTGFINLPISYDHIKSYQSLPLMPEHRDPFDRFIISTAIVENLIMLTLDSKFQLYQDYIQII